MIGMQRIKTLSFVLLLGLSQAVAAQRQPDVIYVHKMGDLAVLKTLVACGRPVVRMVHDHDLYCMRSYKYHPISRSICTRGASAYCIVPCGAPILRNRNGLWPFRWVSFWDKLKEIKLNRQFERMVVATDYMKQELLRNGFDAARIEIHAPVPRTNEVTLQSSFSPRNLIVYAGQIIRGKGVDVLLESLAKGALGALVTQMARIPGADREMSEREAREGTAEP